MNRRELIALGLAAGFPLPAWAQGKYPDRPIRMVVPFAPGGVVDLIGRLWSESVKDALGTVVVENQGGAGGTTGASFVARAAADGYTILLGNTSTQVVNPSVMDKPPYDPGKAFTAVSIVANSAVAFAVHPDVPAKTLPELIAYVRADKKTSYGSPGAGTLTHLGGEIFKQLAGLPDLAHVPYKGAGPGINDLVGGHIPMMALNITGQVLELHRGNKIRIVATCTPKRLDVLKDVQAAPETLPNMIAQLFTGLFVPAATDKAIVTQIADANRKVAKDESYRKRLIESGFDPVVDTPAEAQAYIEAEIARLVPLVKAVGFKPT